MNNLLTTLTANFNWNPRLRLCSHSSHELPSLGVCLSHFSRRFMERRSYTGEGESQLLFHTHIHVILGLIFILLVLPHHLSHHHGRHRLRHLHVYP